MTNLLFYQYNLYTLEQKNAELKTVEYLENEKLLCQLIEPFLKELADLLFISIDKDETADISKLNIPQIESELKEILKENIDYNIYSNKSTHYTLSETVLNKFISRIFSNDGRNDESFIIQNHLHSWLEKRLANTIIQDPRFAKVQILVALLERTEMLHNFYTYLKDSIPQEWILNNKSEWTAVNVTPENILQSIRTFDRDYFTHYLEHLANADKSSLFNYIDDVVRGSDYAMLNTEFSFKSAVLLKNDPEIWLEFWDKLKYPVIQDCVYHSHPSFTPNKYLELFEAITSQKTKTESDSKLLLGITAKSYFDASIKLTEQLSLYNEDERVNDLNRSFFEEGRKCNEEWLGKKEDYYDLIIKKLKLCLDNSEIEDWIFSYKPKIDINNTNKLINIYNSEIELLTNTFKAISSEYKDFSLENLNLQKFNFYTNIIKESDDKTQSRELLDSVLDYIESDLFYWDNSFSDLNMSSLRGISYLICLESDPIKKTSDIIYRFKINYQGWKPDKIDHKALLREAFIYCAVALLFEQDVIWKNPSSSDFFKKFIDDLLKQTRYALFDNSDYYEKPLILLFLIVSQIRTENKEQFEMTLIENYDNFYSLLYILAYNDTTITDRSKVLLENIVNSELPIIKKQLENRTQRDKIILLGKMIEKLELDN